MMSTLKDILVSGVGKAKELPQKIAAIPAKVASWSQKTQIIVAACTAGTLMVASVGGVAIYQHNSNKQVETVAEVDTEPVAVVEETELPEAVFATEIIEIPDFVTCTVSGSSIEKDLTLYIKGSDKKKIEGQQFEIKLISPNDKSKLTDAIAAIDEINEQIEALNSEASEDEDSEEKNTSATTSDESSAVSSTTGNGTLTLETEEETTESTEAGEEIVYISSVTGEEVTDEESLLYAKEQAIEAYAEVLASLDGDTYTDSDSDGMIYIDSITEGDYLACLVPAASYDPENYTVKVNVKEHIEYEAVEDIEDKTVSESKAGDVEETHEDVVVEETLTDTVEWVDSRVETTAGTYSEAKASLAAGSKGEAGKSITVGVSKKDETETEGADNGSTDDGTEEPKENENNVNNQVKPEGEGGESVNLESVALRSRTSTRNRTATAMALSTRNTLTTATTLGTRSNSGKIRTVSKSSNETGGEATASLTLTVDNNKLYQCQDKSLSQTTVSVNWANTEYPVKLQINGEEQADTSATLDAAKFSAGTVTVTATVKGANEVEQTVSVDVTIVSGTTALTDASGHALYKDNKGAAAATVADYTSADQTFYYKSSEESYKYYGWQTINGIRYYYDKNGNRVTGTQVIMGNKYNFGSDGALLTSGYGIDVSKWQGSIDWSKAKSAVSFAIIRAGFRGSSGALSVDSYAGTNIKNAKANGVKVGLYVYSRAVNEVQAVEEASLAISVAKQYGGISLPIYIDMEADNQKSLTTAQRDAIVIAFCKTVKNAGYQAGVYANKNWLTNYLTPSSYTGYSIWCAQYNTSCTYGGRYDIWQYSSKGSIPGINGNVDLDQSFF
jgi:GH25 family lysozyme M1 (1,4-beta-N-acetylmuramidase)